MAQPAQGTWQSDPERTRKIGECSSCKTTALQLLSLVLFRLFIVKHDGEEEPVAQAQAEEED